MIWGEREREEQGCVLCRQKTNTVTDLTCNDTVLHLGGKNVYGSYV